jgi:hypothetical protein
VGYAIKKGVQGRQKLPSPYTPWKIPNKIKQMRR